MKTTAPITYVYRIEHEGVAHEVAITRRHTGTAYARNGNVGNPTEYFRWEVAVDGTGLGTAPNRTEAYEVGRCHIEGVRYLNRAPRYLNVRHYLLVQNEMKSNYVRRQTV